MRMGPWSDDYGRQQSGGQFEQLAVAARPQPADRSFKLIAAEPTPNAPAALRHHRHLAYRRGAARPGPELAQNRVDID
jgi:hypothetical protein